MTPPPRAGWYRDHEGPVAVERWWSGHAWTQHIRPLPEPPSQPADEDDSVGAAGVAGSALLAFAYPLLLFSGSGAAFWFMFVLPGVFRGDGLPEPDGTESTTESLLLIWMNGWWLLGPLAFGLDRAGSSLRGDRRR